MTQAAPHPPRSDSAGAELPGTGMPCAASRQPAAEQAAEAVANMLRLARGMVQSGRRVELEGLDQMVGRLCARCLDLPPEEGRALRPHLAALLVEIDALNASFARAQPP
jgi:hypothetical protein